ncbi:MAG: hypothetical protein PHV16_00735 [Candidatus Nanoarchaeia archaeon]|nr:hypothetical protein [Candidatus Nanoarchaeia archaeon]
MVKWTKEFEDIVENYYFVAKIKDNGERQFIGTFEDRDLYYSRKKNYELKIDNNFYKPDKEEMERIKSKYLIV